jgi:hypothetical protein
MGFARRSAPERGNKRSWPIVMTLIAMLPVTYVRRSRTL